MTETFYRLSQGFHPRGGMERYFVTWPIGWRIWRPFAIQYPDDTQTVCGWGNQIGAIDPEHVEGLGSNGMLWTPRADDKTATDWELL